jgi:hypothetical protein
MNHFLKELETRMVGETDDKYHLSLLLVLSIGQTFNATSV